MGLIEFKVGDRVCHKFFGKGRVIAISMIAQGAYIGVEFEKSDPRFGTLGGRTKAHHGLWCFPISLSLDKKNLIWD